MRPRSTELASSPQIPFERAAVYTPPVPRPGPLTLMDPVASAFRRKVIAACAAAVLLLLVAPRLFAHDIPASVIVQAFVRPQGDRLHLLVRVPLGAMRDVEFPLQGDGLLDISRADRPLRDAALLWLAKDITLYEGDRALGAPALVAARAALPSDRSFLDFQSARAAVTGPALPAGTTLYWNQAYLDVLFD